MTMRKRIILLTLAALLLTVPAAWLNLQTGVFIGDDFLRRTDSGYGPIAMIGQEDATQFTGMIDGFSWAGAVRWEGNIASVTFPDGVTVTGTWDGRHLCDLSGVPYAYTADAITIVVNNESVPPSHTYQADVLCRMSMGETEQRGSLWCVAIGLLLYLIGALSILFPDKMHFFGGRWMYDQAELSDIGRFVQQLAGWVGLATAVFVMYMPLFYFLTH